MVGSFKFCFPYTCAASGAMADGEELIDAAGSDDEAVCNALLDAGTSVDAIDPDGNTALMEAASLGHLDVARLLLVREAQIDLQNKSGYTVVHGAALWRARG